MINIFEKIFTILIKKPNLPAWKMLLLTVLLLLTCGNRSLTVFLQYHHVHALMRMKSI